MSSPVFLKPTIHLSALAVWYLVIALSLVAALSILIVSWVPDVVIFNPLVVPPVIVTLPAKVEFWLSKNWAIFEPALFLNVMFPLAVFATTLSTIAFVEIRLAPVVTFPPNSAPLSTDKIPVPLAVFSLILKLFPLPYISHLPVPLSSYYSCKSWVLRIVYC